MKKRTRLFYGTFLLFGLFLFFLNRRVVLADVDKDREVFESYEIQMEQEERQEISAYALRTDKITVQAQERVSYFDSSDYGEGHKPRITTSIKYILQDASHGDSRDTDGSYRKRYVYCLSHEKDAPIGQTLSQSGWTDPAVYYVIYHGAVYYGETCRRSAYSTGNWQWDYLATHFAVVVVTGQYTLDDVTVSIRRGNASEKDKETLITAISNMVKDAVGEKGFEGFNSDGWFCVNAANEAGFTLKITDRSFVYKEGKYYSDWIIPYFTTLGNYYANDQIVAFSQKVSEEIEVEKKYADSIHSPYRLVIEEETYKHWQRTGKTITTSAEISVPAYWKMAQFASPVDTGKYQNVALPVYDAEKKNEVFAAELELCIPRAYVDLKVKKVSVTEEQEEKEAQPLEGAEFTLYTDPFCKVPVGSGVTDETGIVIFKDLNLNQTYYLVETTAPTGYRLPETDQIYEINTQTEEQELCYTVWNQTGKKLPETGSGAALFMGLAGLILMIPVIRKKKRSIYE